MEPLVPLLCVIVFLFLVTGREKPTSYDPKDSKDPLPKDFE